MIYLCFVAEKSNCFEQAIRAWLSRALRLDATKYANTAAGATVFVRAIVEVA